MLSIYYDNEKILDIEILLTLSTQKIAEKYFTTFSFYAVNDCNIPQGATIDYCDGGKNIFTAVEGSSTTFVHIENEGTLNEYYQYAYRIKMEAIGTQLPPFGIEYTPIEGEIPPRDEAIRKEDFSLDFTAFFPGEIWRAPGSAMIQSTDSEKHTFTVYSSEGNIPFIEVGDLCKATRIAAVDPNSYLCYFCIDQKQEISNPNGTKTWFYTYSLKPNTLLHPKEGMNLICFGNKINPTRQSSVLETNRYTCMYTDWKDWEDYKISMMYGDLSTLTLHGQTMKGYSMYADNLYLKGVIEEGIGIVDKEGNSTGSLPITKGLYNIDKCYICGNIVTDGTQSYQYINKLPESGKPLTDKRYWLLYVAQGSQGESAYTIIPYGSPGFQFYREGHSYNATIGIRIIQGKNDITAQINSSRFDWTRLTPNTTGDNEWNIAHKGKGKEIIITDRDLYKDTVFQVFIKDESDRIIDSATFKY